MTVPDTAAYDELAERAALLTRELNALEARRLEIAAERLQIVGKLRDAGASQRNVASILGVAHIRARQLAGVLDAQAESRARSEAASVAAETETPALVSA